MYILYGGKYTRAMITQMVFAEGSIEYELRNIDVIAGEHRSKAFLDICPTGLVPALITPEGDTLYETPAINLYLAERHQLKHLAPGIGEADRGIFLSGLFYLTDEIEPCMKQYFYPHRYLLQEDDSEPMREKCLNDAVRRFRPIEDRLRDTGPYYLGERFSLVDLTMCYWMNYLATTGFFDNFPAIRKCLGLTEERPRIRSHFDQLREWCQEYADLQTQGTVDP